MKHRPPEPAFESQSHRTPERDRAVLAALHRAHEGRRAFILGSGPSIGSYPAELFSRLSGEVTIACNFLMRWKGLTFQPSYWAMSEPEWQERISTELDRWERRQGFKRTGRTRRIIACRYPPDREGGTAGMAGSKAAGKWAWVWRTSQVLMQNGHLGGPNAVGEDGVPYFFSHSGSVVLDCGAQLALWMGCTEVYLLGVDLDAGGHVYDPPNTYIPFLPGQSFLDGAKVAENVLRNRGIRLVNLAPGGNLTITRGKLEDVL